MLADAVMTSRKKFDASVVPIAAIRPISQIAVRWVSRSVVATSSLLPLAYSRAMASIMSGPTYRPTSSRRRVLPNSPEPKDPQGIRILEKALRYAAGIELSKDIIILGTKEGERSNEASRAHA